MELREYLFRRNLSIEKFALQIGYHRNTIGLISKKKHVPSRALAKLIESETKGVVTFEELRSKRVETPETSDCT